MAKQPHFADPTGRKLLENQLPVLRALQWNFNEALLAFSESDGLTPDQAEKLKYLREDTFAMIYELRELIATLEVPEQAPAALPQPATDEPEVVFVSAAR